MWLRLKRDAQHPSWVKKSRLFNTYASEYVDTEATARDNPRRTLQMVPHQLKRIPNS